MQPLREKDLDPLPKKQPKLQWRQTEMLRVSASGRNAPVVFHDILDLLLEAGAENAAQNGGRSSGFEALRSQFKRQIALMLTIECLSPETPLFQQPLQNRHLSRKSDALHYRTQA